MSEQTIKGVISVIPDGLVKPAGTITITQNGNYNVSKYVIASVNVESGGSGVTYPFYDKTFEGNARLESGYSVTFSTETISDYSTCQTKAKANTAPTSNTDYTISTDSINETTKINNINELYLWGYGYRINDGEIISLSIVNDYTQNYKIEITENCTITLVSSYYDGGGAGGQ